MLSDSPAYDETGSGYQPELMATDRLGVACVKVYHDFLHFELPVLEVTLLDCARQAGAAPFPSDTLLYHAFTAACIPWLDVDIARQGDHAAATKQELLDHHLDRFQVRFPSISAPRKYRHV